MSKPILILAGKQTEAADYARYLGLADRDWRYVTGWPVLPCRPIFVDDTWDAPTSTEPRASR